MDARPALGRGGEDAAERFYRSQGYRVLDRNYRCDSGELDLVVRKGSLIAFCEVKTRTTDRFGDPAEAVRRAKQLRLRRLAARWLAHRRPGAVDIRFDVVSVIVRGGRHFVQYIPDAF